MAVVHIPCCTAPACCQAAGQLQAVCKPSVRDMATPRRKRSHYGFQNRRTENLEIVTARPWFEIISSPNLADLLLQVSGYEK